jgi:hypothetical protein
MSFPKIDFRERRDFGQVMNAGFAFIRLHFKPLGRIILFIVGPLALVGSILPSLAMLALSSQSMDAMRYSYTSFSVNFFSFVIAFTLLIAIVNHYVLIYVREQPEKITLAQVWKAVRKDFFKVFFTLVGGVFVFGIVYTGFIFVIGIVATGTGIGAVFSNSGIVAIVLGLLLLAVFISVTVGILAVALMLFIIRLQERRGFFNAMGRFFDLARGSWWQVLGLQFVSLIIQFSVLMVIYLPYYLFLISGFMLGAREDSYLLQMITFLFFGIVAALLNVFSLSLSLIMTALQYFSLVEKKEAVGLLEEIERMGTQTETIPTQPDEEELY